jgi:hypothetical protein
MALKPLGKLKELVESVGMGISYAYDDLVFPDHNGFLLQFNGDGDSVTVHINIKADRKEVEQAIEKLKSAAASTSLTFSLGTFYTLAQSEDETISIEFHEQV